MRRWRVRGRWGDRIAARGRGALRWRGGVATRWVRRARHGAQARDVHARAGRVWAAHAGRHSLASKSISSTRCASGPRGRSVCSLNSSLCLPVKWSKSTTSYLFHQRPSPGFSHSSLMHAPSWGASMRRVAMSACGWSSTRDAPPPYSTSWLPGVTTPALAASTIVPATSASASRSSSAIFSLGANQAVRARAPTTEPPPEAERAHSYLRPPRKTGLCVFRQ